MPQLQELLQRQPRHYSGQTALWRLQIVEGCSTSVGSSSRRSPDSSRTPDAAA